MTDEPVVPTPTPVPALPTIPGKVKGIALIVALFAAFGAGHFLFPPKAKVLPQPAPTVVTETVTKEVPATCPVSALDVAIANWAAKNQGKIKAFQTVSGLRADGIVGPSTFTAFTKKF